MRNMRHRAESTVGQIAEETSIVWKMGTEPCYFGTFTTDRYQWSAIRKLLEKRGKCEADFERADGSTRKRVNTTVAPLGIPRCNLRRY